MNTRKFYTWDSHAHTFAETVKTLKGRYHKSEAEKEDPALPVGVRIANIEQLLISDIDNTLLGGSGEPLNHLIAYLKKHRDHLGFGVATGRVLESTVQVLKENKITPPDIIISGVGSEIHYGPALVPDRGWEALISQNWNREKIISTLKTLKFLILQDESVQRPYKISYHMKPEKDRLALIHNLLSRNRCHYKLIYSHEKYLDILPSRASKGKAIRYITNKWEIPLKDILVSGDSGNDEEMLRGQPQAVVVGNYSPELESLKSGKNIYFASAEYAKGIMEGIRHYGFLENLNTPQSEEEKQ
jgi:sucrose-phosphate synthase